MLRELIRAQRTSRTPSSSATASATWRSCSSRYRSHGFNAGALHGDMDQMSRTATLDAFRERRAFTFLAASDVAARGLDIPERQPHLQFRRALAIRRLRAPHRPYRPGRQGGPLLTIVTPDDIRQLKDIEKMLGVAVTWIGPVPSAEDLANGSKRRRGRRQGKAVGCGRGTRRRPDPARAATAQRPARAKAHRAITSLRRRSAPKAPVHAAGNRPPRPCRGGASPRPARRRAASVASRCEASGGRMDRPRGQSSLRGQSEAALGTARPPAAASPGRSQLLTRRPRRPRPGLSERGPAPDAALSCGTHAGQAMPTRELHKIGRLRAPPWASWGRVSLFEPRPATRAACRRFCKAREPALLAGRPVAKQQAPFGPSGPLGFP